MLLNVSGYLLIRLSGILELILIRSLSMTNAGEMEHEAFQPTREYPADDAARKPGGVAARAVAHRAPFSGLQELFVQRGARALVDAASRLEDLKTPPGNRLHQLERDRVGQHAIRINDQWRVCFRFEDGDAFDVRITDYH